MTTRLLNAAQQRTKTGLTLFAVVLILSLAFFGCGMLSSNAQAEADLYSIVAPAHERYVQEDGNLPADAKVRRLELLSAWRKRIIANGGVIR